MIETTLCTLVVLSVTILFTAVGHALILRSNLISPPNPISLHIGLGYFTGACAFLSLWKLFAFLIQSASIALGATLLVLFCCLLFLSHWKNLPGKALRTFKERKGLFFLFFVGIPLFALLHWLRPGWSEFNTYSPLGSLEAGRYANIATYILFEDRIPVLGQNYGQSLLASIPMFFGGNLPYLALHQWLVISMLLLGLTVFGIFRYFGLGYRAASLSCLLILMGNTALSLARIGQIDTGNPILLSGYSDPLRSLGSFIAFIFWLRILEKKNGLPYWIMGCALAFNWPISCLQNNLMALGLVATWLIVRFIKKQPIQRFATATLLILLLSILGTLLGGMLCPPQFRDQIDVPDMVSFKVPERRQLYFWPGVAHTVSGKYFPDQLGERVFTFSEVLGINSINKWWDFIYHVESVVWTALRMNFFPLMGILLLGILLFNSRWHDEQRTHLWVATAVTFTLGFCVSFFFAWDAYKWPLTRFMTLSHTLGSLCFVLSIHVFFQRLARDIRVFAWIVLCMFMLAGPIPSIALAINQSLKNPSKTLQHFTMLTTRSGFNRVSAYSN